MANPYAGMVENVRKLAVYFQSVIDLADEVEQLGILESHRDELTAARQTALNEKDEADRALDLAEQAVKDAKTRATKILDDASAEAEQVSTDAHQRADAIVANAITQAEERASQRESELNTNLALLANKLESETSEVTAVSQKLHELQTEVAEVEAQRKAAQSGLDDLNARIVKLAGAR